jgi:hypothetical protein
VLRAVQEPKLGLNHLKPVIGLQRLSCLRKERQMSSRKVPIGGWSLSWGGAGHELAQQLSLLIPLLKDGGDSLGQGW